MTSKKSGKTAKNSEVTEKVASETVVQSIRLNAVAWKAAQLRCLMEGYHRQDVVSRLLEAWAGPEYMAAAGRIMAQNAPEPEDEPVRLAAELVNKGRKK
jgi:hypothetical protein